MFRGYQPFGQQRPLSASSASPYGLLAGWGRFPVEVAQALVRDGHSVCCLAISGHASKDLESICDDVHWLGVGKIGGHLKYFRRSGCKQVTMAGKLFKADILYSHSHWIRHVPDWTCLRTLGPHLFGRNRDARDDSMLLSITEAYHRVGLEICPATDFAPELLVKSGLLTGTAPKENLRRDIEVGWQVAKQMGALDIGQAITIKDGVVIAVEAIEGTDACIERTGQLCKRGGWTLVKVSKPQQDMRFDVPTVGPQTIEKVRAAGGAAIAIEAGMTIMVEQERTLREADKAGITIMAMSDPATEELHAPQALRRAG